MFKFFTTLPEEKAKTISPVTLAFVGDAVYTLYVREKLVICHDFSTGTMQKLSSSEVSAHGQNALLEKFFPPSPKKKRRYSNVAETQKNPLAQKTLPLRNTTIPPASKRFWATSI